MNTTSPSLRSTALLTDLPTIAFAIGQSTIGTLLAASSLRGICAVSFGTDETLLIRSLRTMFPRHQLVRDQVALAEATEQIRQMVDEPAEARTVDLQLDLGGTNFEKAVWSALQAIPVGETRTYKDIAQLVGGTPQEVGEACSANRIALLVPCHRIIRSDGSLAGFRWGVDRKKMLLQRERDAAPDPDSLFATAALSKGKAPF